MIEAKKDAALLPVRSNAGLAEDLATLNWECTSDHYRALFERHMADSTRYQALLYHSWKSLREQQKGLRRQAQKIKRLKQKIAELTPNVALRGAEPASSAERPLEGTVMPREY